VSRQQAQKKICLDFVREFFITSVWLQAKQYLALAACGTDPSKAKKRLSSPTIYYEYSALPLEQCLKKRGGFGSSPLFRFVFLFSNDELRGAAARGAPR
jgi:hypothetical protein